MEQKPIAQPPEVAQKNIDGIVPNTPHAVVDNLPQGAVFTEVPSGSIRSEVGVHSQSGEDVPIEFETEQADSKTPKADAAKPTKKKTREPKQAHSGSPTVVIIIATIFLIGLFIAAFLANGSTN